VNHIGGDKVTGRSDASVSCLNGLVSDGQVAANHNVNVSINLQHFQVPYCQSGVVCSAGNNYAIGVPGSQA
jgi:hypothetical protein